MLRSLILTLASSYFINGFFCLHPKAISRPHPKTFSFIQHQVTWWMPHNFIKYSTRNNELSLSMKPHSAPFLSIRCEIWLNFIIFFYSAFSIKRFISYRNKISYVCGVKKFRISIFFFCSHSKQWWWIYLYRVTRGKIILPTRLQELSESFLF